MVDCLPGEDFNLEDLQLNEPITFSTKAGTFSNIPFVKCESGEIFYIHKNKVKTVKIEDIRYLYTYRKHYVIRDNRGR